MDSNDRSLSVASQARRSNRGRSTSRASATNTPRNDRRSSQGSGAQFIPDSSEFFDLQGYGLDWNPNDLFWPQVPENDEDTEQRKQPEQRPPTPVVQPQLMGSNPNTYGLSAVPNSSRTGSFFNGLNQPYSAVPGTPLTMMPGMSTAMFPFLFTPRQASVPRTRSGSSLAADGKRVASPKTPNEKPKAIPPQLQIPSHAPWFQDQFTGFADPGQAYYYSGFDPETMRQPYLMGLPAMQYGEPGNQAQQDVLRTRRRPSSSKGNVHKVSSYSSIACQIVEKELQAAERELRGKYIELQKRIWRFKNSILGHKMDRSAGRRDNTCLPQMDNIPLNDMAINETVADHKQTVDTRDDAVSATSHRRRSASTYSDRHSREARSRSDRFSSTARSASTRSSQPSNQRSTSKRNKSVYAEVYDRERPQIDPNKPWIRVNATTSGKTTRTAKCNSFNPDKVYRYTPHPVGDWRSSATGTLFQYTNHGEWKKHRYSAEEIKDFIFNYPEDVNAQKKKKLTLWIQVGPTDSARRYLTSTWSKCRFEECPTYLHGAQGTIVHGHYRVAFDERDDPDYDPFLACCGYVHLYCLERFLDLEYLCRKAHVKLDTRELQKEPKGKFAASLYGHPEVTTVTQFITAARRSKKRGDNSGVRRLKEFKNYPIHEQYRGKPKPHEDTLVYHMHTSKQMHRPPAQVNAFLRRGLQPSHVIVHRGDLEFVAHYEIQLRERRKFGKKMNRSVKRKANNTSEDDEFDLSTTEADHHVEFSNKFQHLIVQAKQLAMEVASKHRPREGKMRKHQEEEELEYEEDPPVKYGTGRQPWEVDDDEDSDPEQFDRNQMHVRPVPTRRSNRLRTAGRVPNYREPDIHDAPEITHAQQAPHGYTAASEYHPAYETEPVPPQESYIDPELEGLDFEKYFRNQGLQRRTSSRMILQSRSASQPGKRASFNSDPVSRKVRFNSKAPPRALRHRNILKELQLDPTSPIDMGPRVLRSGSIISPTTVEPPQKKARRK